MTMTWLFIIGAWIVGPVLLTVVVALLAFPLRLFRATRDPVLAVGIACLVLFVAAAVTNGIETVPLSLAFYSGAFLMAAGFYARRDLKRGLPFESAESIGVLSFGMGSVTGTAFAIYWAYGLFFGPRLQDWNWFPRAFVALLAFSMVGSFVSYVLGMLLVGLAALAIPVGRPAAVAEHALKKAA